MSDDIFEVYWYHKAEKEFKKLPHQIRERFKNDIKKLPHPFSISSIKKLKNYRNTYRIRSGAYRIILEIYLDLHEVYIVAVGHRKNIYKNY